jgi:hypothetical protein
VAVPVEALVEAEVGGDHVEPVAFRGADDVRVADPALPEGGAQDGLAAVEVVEVQRVVALAEGEVDLLAVGVLALEVRVEVAGIRRGSVV